MEPVQGAHTPLHADSIISLRLLALILCSNCSNTFNKVLMPKWHHTVKLLFANSVHHFSLLKMCHGWSKHFTSRYDPSTPHHPTPKNIPPQTQQSRATACAGTGGGRQVTSVEGKRPLRWPERCGGGVSSGFLFCFTHVLCPTAVPRRSYDKVLYTFG